MRVYIVIFLVMLCLSNKASAQQGSGTLQFRLNRLESTAGDGAASTRHRWAIMVKGFESDWSKCYKYGVDGKGNKTLNYQDYIFHTENFSDLTESISVNFAGYEDEGDAAECWPDVNKDDYVCEKLSMGTYLI